ncbi:glycine--tRNA ligase subunit beta [Gorillibacterium sp. sgz5001074]|uniref:glycine--tRNA ligase subunit beta n=1 Tax=Gorillibacterium sp. sgz5001074 TaxID=3446695 RepID=UPI003F678E82
MAKDLLLEIGMEEIPSRFIRAAVEQLADKTSKWLLESRIDFGAVRLYATPRRITVLVEEVAEKQKDVSEEAKGPSRKIAQDESGQWTKAALGFAKSQGVLPEQLYFKELGGVEYVHAVKSSLGVETAGVLTEGLTTIIQSLNFPKNMRWGSYDMRFVRPIRWMVALFGQDIIPITLAGVTAGRVTKGHRFLGTDTEIGAPSEYVAKLKEQYVFADIFERETLIRNQLAALAADKGWTIPIKEDLLEEVLFLVEFPTILFGTFNPDFLNIPQEVLITSMREHQRYFPVLNAEGKLQPFFVTFRNGNSNALEQIAKGNEKVLRARLSDAKFFYEEDQKLPIATALSKLETVVFHEELGTVGDKVRRIVKAADGLARLAGADQGTAASTHRAAEICKFDLVTNMVYEFPELQGLMGEDYARKAGEQEAVAKAVNEHYQPRFSGDASPASLTGALVSIADKIDTIAGCFSIGIVPTGSQDPYALRRQAAGIIQILLDHKLPVKLSQLFELAIGIHEEAHPLKRSKDEIKKDLADFFLLRIKNVLNEKQVRYDITDAVTAAGIDDVNGLVRRASVIRDAVTLPDFKSAVDAFNRVSNLAAKAESDQVDPSVFADPTEKSLYAAWQSAHSEFVKQLDAGDEQEALRTLAGLKEPINAFFDAVMVMAEDLKVRSNRLGLLSLLASDVKRLADFSKLVW